MRFLFDENDVLIDDTRLRGPLSPLQGLRAQQQAQNSIIPNNLSPKRKLHGHTHYRRSGKNNPSHVNRLRLQEALMRATPLKSCYAATEPPSDSMLKILPQEKAQ